MVITPATTKGSSASASCERADTLRVVRLTELRLDDAPMAVPLHPRITVMCGLGPDARRRAVDAVARALRGEADDVVGAVDIRGESRPLDRSTAAELGLTA